MCLKAPMSSPKAPAVTAENCTWYNFGRLGQLLPSGLKKCKLERCVRSNILVFRGYLETKNEILLIPEGDWSELSKIHFKDNNH